MKQETLFTLKGSKILLESPKHSLNTLQANLQKTFFSPNSKGNLTARFEPLRNPQRKEERSNSVIKIKYLDDSKIKGLLNLIQERNKKILNNCVPQLNSTPQRVNNLNMTSQNFQKIKLNLKIKSLNQENNSRKFLIHTFRKNSNWQNQDISRPVRSKSDVERTRSKSNLKSPCDESQKKKNVRFNERVEILMFDKIE